MSILSTAYHVVTDFTDLLDDSYGVWYNPTTKEALRPSWAAYPHDCRQGVGIPYLESVGKNVQTLRTVSSVYSAMKELGWIRTVSPSGHMHGTLIVEGWKKDVGMCLRQWNGYIPKRVSEIFIETEDLRAKIWQYPEEWSKMIIAYR